MTRLMLKGYLRPQTWLDGKNWRSLLVPESLHNMMKLSDVIQATGLHRRHRFIVAEI